MISRMNEKITIQHCNPTVDNFGNHINQWLNFFTCCAYASTFIRDETGEVVPLEQRTVVFEVRYCSELKDITSTEYRVVFQNVIYNIDSVDMMNYQKKTIRLTCRKEVRQ